MAISPINSVVSRNYNIGFTGNKKAKNSYNETRNFATSMFKAAPLAAAILMSPLAVSNVSAQSYNNNTVKIEEVDITSYDKTKGRVFREVVSPEGIKPVQVFFNNSDGSKNVKSVVIQTYTSFMKNVLLQKIKFNIVGDDGIPADKTIESSAVLFPERREAIVSPGLYDYLLNFEKNGYKGFKSDNAITVADKVFERNVGLDRNGVLYNAESEQDWIEEGKSEKESFGIEFFNEPVAINTAKGNYNVRAYSSVLGNLGKTFQAVTIERDGAEFKVVGLSKSTLRMCDTYMNNFDNVDLKIIELKRRNSNQKAFIINDELFDALMTAKNDERFDNAFKIESYSPEIRTDGKNVMPRM